MGIYTLGLKVVLKRLESGSKVVRKWFESGSKAVRKRLEKQVLQEDRFGNEERL